MATFSVETRPVVTGRHLKTPVVLRDTREVGGVLFFRASKGDTGIVRLLAGHTWTSCRPLKKADIFDRITSARNRTVDDLIEPPAACDLGLDTSEDKPKKRRRVELANLPEVVLVRLPETDRVPAFEFKVIAGSGRDPLWLECSANVFNYIADVVAIDTEQDTDRMPSPGKEWSNDRGLSYEKARGAFRARLPSGKTKYFRESDYPDALSAARAFLASDGPAEPQAVDDA